ncbi:hypothetical protein Fmac_019311 [Flemingia macrophylla]|uniref:PB1 domain-containing protein n=1 Tax=Flemingia macrophylla TaxID=520843 RepID=A0ABD1M9D5_9FABA
MAMDSRDSSPRSDAAADNHHHASSFDDPPPPSYDGRIQPRPHDNHLTYVAGDTKILSVDRHVKFPTPLTKLFALVNTPSLLKYQFPDEDLDALISGTSNDDLHHINDYARTIIMHNRLRESIIDYGPHIIDYAGKHN